MAATDGFTSRALPRFGSRLRNGFLAFAAPLPRYSLACFDDAGVRHYWTAPQASLANAPTLSNPRVYVAGTLTILKRRT